MELLWVLLSIVAVMMMMGVYKENMTNADVQSALQKYAGVSETPSKYNSAGVSEYPIYGPTAKPPKPEPSGGGRSGRGRRTDGGTYPEIYGPDVELIPGTKPSKPGKHSSDDTSDSTYEFNPDLAKAFPTSGPPQPYLTDFSKLER